MSTATTAAGDTHAEQLTAAAAAAAAGAGKLSYPNPALREALMLQWYRLVPYTGPGECCPRRIVGKHCRSYAGNCACQSGGGEMGVFDHARMWVELGTGELVITGEPYKQASDLAANLGDLRRACTEIGVTVTTGGRSPYAYPHDDCELVVLRG